jgi:hypothetical protein
LVASSNLRSGRVREEIFSNKKMFRAVSVSLIIYELNTCILEKGLQSKLFKNSFQQLNLLETRYFYILSTVHHCAQAYDPSTGNLNPVTKTVDVDIYDGNSKKVGVT